MAEQKTMTLAAFLVESGLVGPGDRKVDEMKKLTDQDKRDFAEMAKRELGIDLRKQDGSPY